MIDRQVLAFTRTFNKIVPVLTSLVRIQDAFDPMASQPVPPKKEYQAIWDTGATRTAITDKVAKECGLKPTGMCKIKTAAGESDTYTYFISLYLPNMVCIPQIRATQAQLFGADVLLGMDIITSGDFVVTNHKGKTCVSFRMPSIECIDFVKPAAIEVDDGKIFRKVGRNEPCPCGSGKKYKHCHGR